MTSRRATTLVSAVLATLLTGAAVALPVPYVRLGPGPTTDTLGRVGDTPLIRVEDARTYPTTGELRLTTVSVIDRPSLPEAVVGWLSDSVAVLPREQYFPPGQDADEFRRQNEVAFLGSQEAAKVAALRELGYDVPVEVVVREVLADGPSQGLVEAGDVLLSVDGEPVTSSTALRDAIRTRAPGDEVRVEVRRGDASQEVTVTTGEAPDDPSVALLGVASAEQAGALPVDIEIELDQVGGPSAGLMFALGIVDVLTQEDLTGGEVIAGTGEIAPDGRVGPIGGIRQKLVAADDAGAGVFLVPADNCAEALTDPPEELRLLRVATLEDALTALATLDDGGRPATC